MTLLLEGKILCSEDGTIATYENFIINPCPTKREFQHCSQMMGSIWNQDWLLSTHATVLFKLGRCEFTFSNNFHT